MVGPDLGLIPPMSRATLLLNLYGAMHDELGPSRWWPGDSPFEIARAPS